MQRICVFCGSSMGARPDYRVAAERLGGLLAARGIELVYGGANAGLMGVIANAVLAAGGRVTGVIPQSLVQRELAHPGLSELHVVASMHERKAKMASLAEGFIAMPGGYGTFEEFCEILTWAQLGIHQYPCALLNVRGYYDRLLAMFDHAAEEQLLKPEYRKMVVSAADPEALLDAMAAFRHPNVPKWIGLSGT